MNCDQAFDVMTDSAQRDSAALQRHLANCPRCRDMAEAFEPALQLFDEACQSSYACLEHDDDTHCEFASTDDVNNRRRAANERSTPNELTRRRLARMEGFKVAVVLVFVGAFTAAITRLGHESPLPLARVSEITTAGCLRQELDPQAQSAPTLAACLACHLDSAESLKVGVDARDRVHRIVRNCVVCHLEMTTQVEIAASETLLHGPCSRRQTDG